MRAALSSLTRGSTTCSLARYSSPATAALGRLLLPYLFPELSAFATVEDLVSHLHTSNARYHAAAPAEYNFLSLDHTVLTMDLLEQHLLAAETSTVAVGAARGTPRTPFFEGCSPFPLTPSYASAAALDVSSAEDAGAASASAKCRSRNGKGGRGGGGGSGVSGGGSNGGGGGSGGGGSGGSGGGIEGFGGGGGGSGGSGGRGSGGSGGGRTGAQRGGSEGGQRKQQQRRSETPSPQQLCEWLFQRGVSAGSGSFPYVIPTGDRAVAIFDLDYDAILSAMYALSVSAEGECYQCVPLDPGIEAAALGASGSSLPGTAPVEALHTFKLDSGASRSCVSGQGRERYFLLVVDDYTRYTTVFPLHSKDEVPWICANRLQLGERFSQDILVLRLHSDRGGEFSFDLLWDFCRREGIIQSFTLPASPRQNGIAEHRIGLVMKVARTSMIHATAPHFLWLFAVRYAVHQLNLLPLVSLPETSPTLRWMGEVGDASVFWVCGSRSFVRDTSANKLSARAIPCVFLGFPPDAPGWQSYHPTSSRVFPSQDLTFDKSVPFYRLFPYRSAPPPHPPLFLAPAGDSGAARGATSGGVASGGAEPGGAESESGGSGTTELGGADLGEAEPGGAETVGVEPGGAEPEGVEPGGAESEGVESGGAGPWGTASAGGPVGASPRLSPRPQPLSPQQLHEWLAQRAHFRSGAVGAGDPAAGDTGAGGARVTARAGGTEAGESIAPSALVAELLEFAAACRLDYAIAFDAESESTSPPLFVGGECALGTDVLQDRQEDFECLAAAVPLFASMLLAPEGDPDGPNISTPRSYAEAITGPYSSQWQAAMDAEMAS
ncbi:unnamed protein product [Closterium sp. NIES-53]